MRARVCLWMERVHDTLTRHSRENGMLFAHTLKYARELSWLYGILVSYVGSGGHPGEMSFSVSYLVGDQFDPRHHNDLLTDDFKEVRSYSVKY